MEQSKKKIFEGIVHCNYSLLGFLISIQHCTLDTCGVHVLCLTLLRTLDYTLLCWQYQYSTPLNPYACSPLNHTAKTPSNTPTTIFLCYYFMQYLVAIFHLIISSISSQIFIHTQPKKCFTSRNNWSSTD